MFSVLRLGQHQHNPVVVLLDLHHPAALLRILLQTLRIEAVPVGDHGAERHRFHAHPLGGRRFRVYGRHRLPVSGLVPFKLLLKCR